MRLAALLAILACAAFVAAGTGCQMWDTQRYVVSFDGHDKVVPPRAWHDARRAVVVSRAARDLACPMLDVSLEVHPQVDVVRGCGRTVVEATVSYLDYHGTRHVLVVPVSNGDDPAALLGSFGQDPNGDSTWEIGDEEIDWRVFAIERLGLLEAIVAAGAHDLPCATGDVVPEVVTSIGGGADTSLADGCGRRTSYVYGTDRDLHLTARVDLAPPKA